MISEGPRLPKVAVIGRQNVGKSTLVNRIFGRRETIAHEMPGVTRDRVELETTWGGRTFTLVDTGGFMRGASGIEALVSEQAERAARGADVVVLVVDVQTGPLDEDSELARRLRKAPAPVIVAVNKVDTERDESEVSAFHRLGLGEPIGVSALHGRGSGDLLDRLVALLPDQPSLEGSGEVEAEPRFALVGKPNVGKSSLFNLLVGEERSVVYEEAGTTRDSVDAVVRWPGGDVRFVDTAGFRRPSKVRGVEFFSFLRAERAIERAHVAVLIIDGSEGLTAEDKRIAARVIEAGRALLIVANKWDLVEEKDRRFKDLTEDVTLFARATILRTSALRGMGVKRMAPELLALHERWRRRIGTAEVNELVQATQDERPTPRGTGRYRYATQVAAAPPTFVFFGARAPDPSYQRFLENRLRATFGFEGVPIRLRFRPKPPRATRG